MNGTTFLDRTFFLFLIGAIFIPALFFGYIVNVVNGYGFGELSTLFFVVCMITFVAFFITLIEKVLH